MGGRPGDAGVPDVLARLLPYFDAFVVGGHPREPLYPGRAVERVAKVLEAVPTLTIGPIGVGPHA